MEESRLRHHQPTESRGKQSKKGSFQNLLRQNEIASAAENNLQYLRVSISDDPYYCGLRARIPNFAKSKAQKEKETPSSRVTQNPLGPAAGVMPAPHHHPMAAWHHGARGYPDNGISWVEFDLYSTYPPPTFTKYQAMHDNEGKNHLHVLKFRSSTTQFAKKKRKVVKDTTISCFDQFATVY